MAWLYLIAAGICEIAWAVGLKYSHGFSRLWPSIVTIVLMLISFSLLSQAMKSLLMGTSYAIWTGIGAAATAILGIILFNEPRDIPRLLCIALILAGIVGLKLTTSTQD